MHVPAGMLRLWLDRLVPETVRMHQGSETAVAAALGRLRAEDERVAGDAEAALGSLTWDQGLQAITQHGLQTFLWYELRKWRRGRWSRCAGCWHLRQGSGNRADPGGNPQLSNRDRGGPPV